MEATPQDVGGAAEASGKDAVAGLFRGREERDTSSSPDQEVGPFGGSSGPAAQGEGEREDKSSGKASKFTEKTQLDVDKALARALQEQERRAYLLYRGQAASLHSEQSGSDLSRSSSEAFSDDLLEGEDADDGSIPSNEAHSDSQNGRGEREFTGLAFSSLTASGAVDRDESAPNNMSDEDLARALQEEEYRETTRRMMALAGVSYDEYVDSGDMGSNSTFQDWHEHWAADDPEADDESDELSYEELVALGEVVGTHSRGLSTEACQHLPRSVYEANSEDAAKAEDCTICQGEFEGGDALITLWCKHSYHEDCVLQWLSINKVCPVCTREVRAPSEAVKGP